MKLNDIIGQEKIKKVLEIQLKACKKHKKLLPHILFSGFSGGGKTSIALAIANELRLPFQQINTASLKDPLSLIYCFVDPNEKELCSKVIFLDEIHNIVQSRAGFKLVESLYTAMEENFVSYEVQGANGKEIKKQEVPPFTLLAATTEGLPEPFLRRFSHNFQLSPYSNEELIAIINNYKKNIDGSLIAPYARSNPREAKRLADWIEDYHSIENAPPSKESVEKAMSSIGIFTYGLTNDDKKYLQVLFNLKKSGIKNLVACTGISESKIIKEIEPFLLQRQYIFRTAQGRIINVDKIKDWL